MEACDKLERMADTGMEIIPRELSNIVSAVLPRGAFLIARRGARAGGFGLRGRGVAHVSQA